MDSRYVGALLRFAKKDLALSACHVKADAGGVRALLNGNRAVRAWMLSNLKLAYSRDVRTAVVVNHQDCAAYGGSVAFKDRASEAAFHTEQLAMAAALLKSTFPRLSVRAFYGYRDRRRIAFEEVKLIRLTGQLTAGQRLNRWRAIMWGSFVLGIGLILIPTPVIPGTPVILAGLTLLSPHLPWARRFRRRLKIRVNKRRPDRTRRSSGVSRKTRDVPSKSQPVS